MKKILALVFVAVALLSSCALEYYHETECYYYIGFGYDRESSSYLSPSEGETLIKEFQKEFSALEAKYESDWKWMLIVKDDDYDDSDKEAKQKFEKYRIEISTFTQDWQEKFNKCSDKTSTYEYGYYLRLFRVSEIGTEELDRMSYQVKLNK